MKTRCPAQCQVLRAAVVPQRHSGVTQFCPPDLQLCFSLWPWDSCKDVGAAQGLSSQASIATPPEPH